MINDTTMHDARHGVGPDPLEDGVVDGPGLGSSESEGTHWFHTLVRNTSDLIIVLDDRARLVYANPATERVIGYSLAEHAGGDIFRLVHPDDVERAVEAFAEDIARPGAHPRASYRIRTSSGEWRVLEVVATNCLDDPVVSGIVVNARDVTERARLARALRTLSLSSEILVRATDEDTLLVDTCRMAVQSGGYALAWVGYPNDDPRRTVRVAASWGETAYLEGIAVSWADEPSGRGPVGQAIRQGTVQVVPDTAEAEEFAPWRERAARIGLRSVCALPLGAVARSFGALAIYAADAGTFSDEAVGLLRGLADNLAYGIGRIRDARALESSEARFRTLAGAAPVGILELGPGGLIEYANARAAEITGRAVDALRARGWVDTVHPDDLPDLIALADSPHPTGPDGRMMTTSFRVLRPDGELRHVRLSGALKEEQPEAYVATLEDVTDEVRAQESLQHQAFYDTLTGLPNRALFLDRLAQELVPVRSRRPHVAVLFLDLDRLKLVNDSLGHEVGDAVLCEVARRLQQGIRAGETVARFSGDEFVFILRDVLRPADAESVATRILQLLQVPIPHTGRDLYVTASIGIVLPGAGTDPRTVVRDADTAMYQAKWSGGNGFALFDDELHHRSIVRLTLEGELREAIRCGEFEMYYQPILDPRSELPIAAEALIRWHHPTRGLVLPGDFIPVAEDSGLVKPIGRFVFERSVSQLAAWHAGDGPYLEAMSINLSARELDDESFEAVRSVLAAHRGIASRVALEVTETSLMADDDHTRKALDRLRGLGLRLAIDDFGTGYSSLAYLHSLPVTTVKIDQSFIDRLGGDEDSSPVVRAIVDMSHALGLRVVAEGVSDERRRRLVSEVGCDFAQGFHWSEPLPAGAFASWWDEATRRAQTAGDRPAGLTTPTAGRARWTALRRVRAPSSEPRPSSGGGGGRPGPRTIRVAGPARWRRQGTRP